MDASFKRYLILPFVMVLVLFFFSAPVGGDPQSRGKGYSTVTFYVA